MTKYYFIRILAALFIMGSFGIGFVIGSAYGSWAGLSTFFVLIAVGIFLHIIADHQYKKV